MLISINAFQFINLYTIGDQIGQGMLNRSVWRNKKGLSYSYGTDESSENNK